MMQGGFSSIAARHHSPSQQHRAYHAQPLDEPLEDAQPRRGPHASRLHEDSAAEASPAADMASRLDRYQTLAGMLQGLVAQQQGEIAELKQLLIRRQHAPHPQQQQPLGSRSAAYSHAQNTSSRSAHLAGRHRSFESASDVSSVDSNENDASIQEPMSPVLRPLPCTHCGKLNNWDATVVAAEAYRMPEAMQNRVDDFVRERMKGYAAALDEKLARSIAARLHRVTRDHVEESVERELQRCLQRTYYTGANNGAAALAHSNGERQEQRRHLRQRRTSFDDSGDERGDSTSLYAEAEHPTGDRHNASSVLLHELLTVPKPPTLREVDAELAARESKRSDAVARRCRFRRRDAVAAEEIRRHDRHAPNAVTTSTAAAHRDRSGAVTASASRNLSRTSPPTQ
jgi:hypothetical protein